MKESGLSSESSGIAELPDPSNMVVESLESDSATLSVQDNANNKAGYRAYVGPDGYLTFSKNGDGSLDNVSVPDDPTLRADNNAFTFAAKVTVKHKMGSSEYPYLIKKNSFLRLNDDGEGGNWALFLQTVDNGVEPRAGGGPAVQAGETWTVVGTWDGSNLRLRSALASADTLTLRSDIDRSGTTASTSTANLILGQPDSDSQVGDLWDVHAIAVDYNHAWSAAGADAFHERLETPTDVSGEWYFNQGSGDTLEDYSGNGNDGTLQNSPTWHGGGSMVQDNGDLPPQYGWQTPSWDDYARTDFSPLNPNSSSFTVSLIVQGDPSTSTNTYPNFFNIRSSGNSNIVFRARGPGNDTYLRFDTEETDRYIDASLDNTFPEPTRITLSYNDATPEGKIYVDGSLYKSMTPATNEPVSLDGTLFFGEDGTNIPNFQWDEWLWYDRALADDEVVGSDAEMPRDYVSRFGFDEGAGASALVDSEGVLSDASINGSPEWVSPITPIRHQIDSLTHDTDYVARMSVFTDHTQSFDS